MSEWIPIEERLPEKEGEYLIRFKDEKSPPEFGYYFPDTDTWHTRFFSTTIKLFNKSLILAWAPLPEMPKKGFELICNHRFYFKSKEQVELMKDKIKKFVESEIGEA